MLGIKTIDPHSVSCGESDAVVAYWDKVRGEAMAPAWGRDFRIEDLPSAIIPNMMVVDVIDSGLDYRYRFWGTNNTLRKGYEMSGKLLSECPLQSAIEQGFKQFGLIIKERTPMAIIYDLKFRDYQSGDQITFRFPLSSDGQTVDKIVSYQDLSNKPQNWEALFDTLRSNK